MSDITDERLAELPHDIRVPLHQLQADMAYLFGRVAADGSLALVMTETVRARLTAIEAAIEVALTELQRRRASPVVNAKEPALDREKLALLHYDLCHIHELIGEGIRKHGSYSVPWGVLSWTQHAADRGAEMLSEMVGPFCRRCDGRGVVANPDARYEMDRDTGNYETNDAEEIECPECDGGYPFPPSPPDLDDEVRF